MDSTQRSAAKTAASRRERLPFGKGRFSVRAIIPSISSSTIWLIAAAEAAARPMPSVAHTSKGNATMPGSASNMPTSAVNTIRHTIFGLHNAR